MTTKRYQCVHCDEPFEPEAGEDKPRCPKCLRMTGVRQLGGTAQVGARPKWLWPAVALGVLLVGGGVYAMLLERRPPDPESLVGQPLDNDTVEQELQRRGLEAHGYQAMLRADAAVEAFAKGALSGASSPNDKAAALVKAIAARKKAGAFVQWPLADARSDALLKAGEVAAALAKDGARKQLYPLEVADLAVAALRSADVPAQVAEVYSFPGERRPPDPSGHLGYFALALPAQGGTAHVFDVYGGRDKQPAAGEYVLLGDLEVVGAALSLHAASIIASNGEPAQALAAADAAIKLLPTSPSVRTTRGAALIASGGETTGVSEFEAAAKMRPDPARRNNLAMLLLAKGERERALREVSLALEAAPDFAAAHISLATIHLSQAEREQAQQELAKAESLEPQLPSLALAWAQFHASGGDMMQALARANEAVRLRPDSPQPRLLLALLYRQAGKYDDMRREARKLLDSTPTSQRERVEERLKAQLGPTAFEEPDDSAAPGGPGLSPPGQLALPEPTLGGDRDGPSLLDKKLGADTPGGLNLGGDPQKLELRQPGSGPKLEFDR